MTKTEIIQVLKKTPMFKNLDKTALSELAKNTAARHLRKDEILFLAGEKANGLFVVAKGAVRAYRENSGGREQVIHVERAPATIAEVPVFDDGVYPATVAAEENATVLFISKKNIRRLFLNYPQIALSALKLMAGRLRRAAALIEEISLQEVRQRLARYLLEEAQRQNCLDTEIVKLKIGLTNQQIAARVGSVREVVSRTLKRLEQEKFIKLEKCRVLVLDVEALARLVNY